MVLEWFTYAFRIQMGSTNVASLFQDSGSAFLTETIHHHSPDLTCWFARLCSGRTHAPGRALTMPHASREARESGG